MRDHWVKILPWYYTPGYPKSRKCDKIVAINYEKEADGNDD